MRKLLHLQVIFLFCLLLSCAGDGKSSLSVKLELTGSADPSILSFDDTIVITIYGPDFPGKSFSYSRSSGSGTIDGIPDGHDRVIKADEYSTTGALVARGFVYGVTTGGDVPPIKLTMVPKGWVITLAGGNSAGGESPDGTYARDVLLNGPTEVEFTINNEIVFIDANNFKIKKIDKYWHMRDLIGNGLEGIVLEDVDKLNTPLENPSSIAISEFGDVYFSIFIENKIFKVVDGKIIKYGGNGSGGFAPEFSIALNSPIYRPKYITYIYGKGLYVLESDRGAVRYININGEIEDNLNLSGSGIGSSGFQGKDLIFSYKQRNTIIMVDFLSKKITQFGDLGYFDPWTNFPDNILYKGCVFGFFPHSLYVCGDGNSNKIYEIKYDGNGSVSSINDKVFGFPSASILQPLPPDAAGLQNPRDLAVDDEGNIYIADTGNNAIRMVVGGAL